jgi:hypothetical protein
VKAARRIDSAAQQLADDTEIIAGILEATIRNRETALDTQLNLCTDRRCTAVPTHEQERRERGGLGMRDGLSLYMNR